MGTSCRGRPQLRPGASAALRATQPPAPARVSAEVVSVDSAGTWDEGVHRRTPEAAREAAPARPHEAGARRRRHCQRSVQVGRGAASCPRLAGGGTESERSGNRLPRELCAPQPRRGSYLWGEGGRPREPARWRRILGARAQLAPLEAGEEGRKEGLSEDRAVSRNSAPGFALARQGWGEAVSVRMRRGASGPPSLGRRSPAAGPLSWSIFLILSSPRVSELNCVNLGNVH